ncbi:fatty acid desaturase [Nocardioides allogilvus]|jgi:alkane 1-monooxygenase|uniref:fatty acid desaturase n=1 Tax=Nocardioides allogilvus TaxID=2072017 RepID=UPI000D325449
MSLSDSMSGTIPEGSTDGWKDSKRYLWLIGLVVPSLALVAILGYASTGWGAWLWLGPIVILVVVPAIDLMTGLDRSNPPDDVIEALEADRYYRWVTYLFLPIQYLGFVGAMTIVAGHNPIAWVLDLVGLTAFAQENLPAAFTGALTLSVLDKLALAISIGCIGGIGINTAHELGHKKEANERWLSKIALAQVAYGHFYIEHNRGHHVRVATPEDPASSRLGENFYQFWPRTVLGSLKSAWHLEKRRYARKKQHPFRPGNDVLNAWVMTLVLWGVLIAWLGIEIAPYLLIQAVIGFSLLEVVNFMEHYGMLRQKVGTGERQRYERVLPSHSWNSNNIATNVLLYHLQRHSDHHANPTRRYQALRDFEESPVLPTGYAGMIVLAIVPAVWRRVMDHRVVDHFGGDVSLANIQPGKRDKYIARYAADMPAKESTVREDVTPGLLVDEVLAARCPGCSYVYEVAAGDEHEGFAAGTAWADIPADWCCPDCGVREKADFVPFDPSKAVA